MGGVFATMYLLHRCACSLNGEGYGIAIARKFNIKSNRKITGVTTTDCKFPACSIINTAINHFSMVVIHIRTCAGIEFFRIGVTGSSMIVLRKVKSM